ncbi:PTS transporter subunit EIIC [Clostridium estertheticum]|uniref:PTS transporter subunit EIIC n=1 Tax=Clostridium estertheticum TaxID=238834 RepID=UPI001CF12A93|nr:PTS transporter subunit EIIC [Clostridium estertheticum]MCB2362429.1 PTS transporter subunit EIIC [Clostridium estertheticum]
MTGTHKSISPVAISMFALKGYDSLFLISFLGFNFSQGAASLAVALKTKNKELKQTAYSAAITTLLAGITEPALYGVSLKLRKPLYANMIGSACAGLFSGIIGLKLYAYVGPSLVSLPAFIDKSHNIIFACISMAITIIVTMIFTFVFGWDDPISDNNDSIDTSKSNPNI